MGAFKCCGSFVDKRLHGFRLVREVNLDVISIKNSVIGVLKERDIKRNSIEIKQNRTKNRALRDSRSDREDF